MAKRQHDVAWLARTMRRTAGLSQTELAKKMRSSQSTVALFETPGYSQHSLETLRRIAKVCGVRLELTARKGRLRRRVRLLR